MSAMTVRLKAARKSNMFRRHVWIKHEHFDGERRAPLSPEDAGHLVRTGINISVEKSDKRIFPDGAYADAGCRLVEPGAWLTHTPPETVVLGIKYLERMDSLDKNYPIRNKTLIHWAHAYDGDPLEQEELSRIEDAGFEYPKHGVPRRYPSLLDLEMMKHPDGTRIFTGYSAGVCGAAMALYVWRQRQAGKVPPYRSLPFFDNKEALLAALPSLLHGIGGTGQLPRVCILGGKGHAGRGAAWLCDQMRIQSTSIDKEQMLMGLLPAALDECHIVMNCTPRAPMGTPPFLTDRILQDHPLPLLIVDVACYPSTGFIRFDGYPRLARWDAPTWRVRSGVNAVDVIAIDNLPNIIAKEASLAISSVLRAVLPDYFESRERGTELPTPFQEPYAAMCRYLDYATEVKDLAWEISLDCFDGADCFDPSRARDMVGAWVHDRLERRAGLDEDEINLFRGYFVTGFKPVYELRDGCIDPDRQRKQLQELKAFAEKIDASFLAEGICTGVQMPGELAPNAARRWRRAAYGAAAL